MFIIIVLLIVGALIFGYHLGKQQGAADLAKKQSNQITNALSDNNDFYKKHRIHGQYLLEGHENIYGPLFMVVHGQEFESFIKKRQNISNYDE